MILFLLNFNQSLAQQGVAISTTNADPNISAILDIISTDKGLLIPRMTSTQRDAITVGAAQNSLIIFNTTLNLFQYWDNNATQWLSISASGVTGNGTAGQVAYWNGTSTQTGSNNLFWDNTNSRLGISNTSPAYPLDVNGAIRSGSNGISGSLLLYSEIGGTDYTLSIVPSAAMTGDYSLTFPIDNGNSGQALTTDGNGVLSWTTITTAADGNSGNIQFNNAGAFTGSDDLHWDFTNGRLGIQTAVPEYEIDVAGAIRSGFDGTDGQFRLFSEQGATDYEVVFQPNATMTQNTIYILPANDGDLGQFLQTDGSGNLSWATAGGGGGGTPAGVTSNIQFNDAGAFAANANFVWDDVTSRLGIGLTSPTYTIDALGSIRSGGNGTSGSLILYSEQGGTDYGIIFNPSSSMTQNVTYTLPVDDGTSGQVLSTDGAGVLSWIANGGGGGGTPGGSTGNIQFNNAGSFAGESALFWDDSNDRLGVGISTPAYKLEVTGSIRAGSDGTSGALRLFSEQGGTDYEVIFQPSASMTQTTTYTLPVDDGTNGQILSTDGSGVLSWIANGGGGGGTPGGSSGNIQFNNAGAFGGENELWYDFTNNRLGINTNSPTYPLDVVGAMRSGGNGTSGALRLFSEQGGTDYEVIFQPSASMTQNTTYTLPVDDGTSGQVLSTDGSGILSWIANGGGGGGTPGGSSGNIQFNNAGAFGGENELWYDFTNNRLGISTSSPLYPLDVLGEIRSGGNGTSGGLRLYSEQGGTDYTVNIIPKASTTMDYTLTLPADDGTSGQFLQSDGTGVLSWVTIGGVSPAWGLSGNGSTNPASNFLGTTDNVDLVFRTNNTERARIFGTGGMAIGTTTLGSGNFLKIGQGNLGITTDGSSTGSPRMIGFEDLTSGEMARVQFGDPQNSLQNGYGQRMQITAYWGIEFTGSTQTAGAKSFVAGAASDPSVTVISGAAGRVALDVRAAASQTANIANFTNSSGTVQASVDNNGAVNRKGWFMARRSSDQTGLTGTETKINWNNTVRADASFFSVSGTDVTVIKTGWYKISYKVNVKRTDSRQAYKVRILAGGTEVPGSISYSNTDGDDRDDFASITTSVIYQITSANTIVDVRIQGKRDNATWGSGSPSYDVKQETNILIEKIDE